MAPFLFIEMDKPQSFGKAEHLCSLIAINELFTRGRRFISFPLSVAFIVSGIEKQNNPKVLFSVPKKNFKRAVKRNLLKRRMREAYRKNKHILQCQEQIDLAFIYISKEIETYEKIEEQIIASLIRINKYLKKKSQ